MDWMQEALVALAVPLGLLACIIVWGLVIFVIVDEILDLFRPKTGQDDNTDGEEYL